jgi:hypothetical protein
VTQHASLAPDRWGGFSLDQQVLMIANEMNRAGKLAGPDDRERLRNAYARVLQLTDLTIMVQPRRALRRELLRWRDLVGALYVAPSSDPEAHAAAMRSLLRFTPIASRQLALFAALAPPSSLAAPSPP